MLSFDTSIVLMQMSCVCVWLTEYFPGTKVDVSQAKNTNDFVNITVVWTTDYTRVMAIGIGELK